MTLKDDMKGLGYNRAKEDEVTGLDVFSDLLSRLNGKSEASVESDQQARLVVKTNRYVEAKWGPMRFVRGGLLVGDEEREVTGSEESTDSTQEAESSETTSRKSKKRRAADLEDSDGESNAEREEKRRRKDEKRAKKLLRLAAETEESNASPDEVSPAKKKSKKDKSKSKSNSDADDKTESKKSKKDKKDKKKRRKEEEAETAVASVPTSAAGTGTSTPTGTGTGTSTPRGSRNFVRSRFIAQKKQAVLDTKALNQVGVVHSLYSNVAMDVLTYLQIFMLKT